MSTRHEKTLGPPSQERYMSSKEFAELHGVSGVAVSARAAILLHAAKKNLIWFMQGLSLAEGGLRRVAKELVRMFPKRLDDDGAECALRETNTRVSYYGSGSYRPSGNQNLEEFLVDLCINPRIHFATPGQDVDVSDIESDSAIEQNPELSKGDFQQAKLHYFRDIIGALFEYKKRYEARVRENFQLTGVGNKVWETLDYALASRGMVVLDGLEGRGKTEAVKAWCELHLGQARFVSLKGITSKTTAFREIAKALGIASSYTRTATEMQARIEDVLKRSKLLLVLDEAHFLFNQSRRMYSRPELIDWIDTAICNCGVGCALVTTPQFIVCMTRAADQVEWNYRQFRRRVKRWVKLPSANTEDEIKAVARNVFKKAPAAALNKIVGYALLSKRDLSAVGDIATEVRAMLGTDDLSNATLKHIHSAIYDFLLPSDKTFQEGMAAARQMGRKSFRKPSLVLPAEELQEPQAPPLDDSKVARRGLVPIADGQRRRAGNPADLVAA
ncbi:MAG TPA: ATP-binding protein [Verrucomicrobiae bacterium]|nr:ATP-binding protein [Verrucomicrobiae bacterium]